MGIIQTLIAKDFRQTYRDKLSFLFTFILPLIFTAFFGFLFGGTGTSTLPVAFVSGKPADTATEELQRLLQESGVVTLIMYEDTEEAERAVASNRVAAAIVVPAGFAPAVNSDSHADVVLVRNLGSAPGQTVEQTVRQSLRRLVGARLAALTAYRSLFEQDSPREDGESWNAALLAAKVSLGNPPLIRLVENSGARANEIPRGFDHASPGMLVNWILFGLLGASITLVLERQNGALRRLLTTQVTRWHIIAGKCGAMMALTIVQQIVLIAVGQFAFGVDYLRSPAALVLTMITVSLLSAGLGLMLAATLKTEGAVIAATVLTSMLLAALGGAWFPLEVTGHTFAAVGHISPAAWVLDAFRGIILKGWGIGQVVPKLAPAWGYACAFLGIAIWRFRFD